MSEPLKSGAGSPAPPSGMRGENGDPVLAIRHLVVHFDLGFDREIALRLAPPRVRRISTAAYAGAALVAVLILVASGPTLVSVYGLLVGALLALLAILGGALAVFVLLYLVQLSVLHALVGSRARQIVKAVDGVSIDIKDGETLGLVGESGCGKSTLGRALLRLTEPTGGQVLFRGRDLARLSKGQLRGQRRHLQMIFQDPYASLNPRMTVSQIIGEPVETFGLATGRGGRESRVRELMQTVGLSSRFVKRYPHEFSGGQRQRIGIARALAADPDFVVADEPISALDVSIP